MLTRRTVLTNLMRAVSVAALNIPALSTFSQERFGAGSNGQQRGEMGRIAGAFRRQFAVPASSIAISRNGVFAFDHADGMADRQHLIPTQQGTLFRIASLSKPITSVAVFTLIEQGKLNLNDKVFGPSAILGVEYGKPPYKSYVADITVDHLLTHTAGGWGADSNDPMLHNNSWNHAKLISETIANVPLTSAPGTRWIYSNFGYCILGRVIEQVASQSYESYVQSKVLAPCGITGMQIAKNKEHDRADNEVVYVGQYSEDPYKLNIERMDSDNGWIASSTQLVQFLNHVAGAPDIPAILKPETVHDMTTPVSVYPGYARGWMVNSNGNWWHNGSLPGSTTIMVRTATGFCWAALCNTRTQPHNEMDAALDEAMWQMVRVVPSWNP